MKYCLSALVLFLSCYALSQKGILPFSGLTYSYHGLSAKEITVELDEATWTSNRLPVNTEFEFTMVEPEGFTAVNDKYYPGIEATMLNPAGDTLGYVPNILDGSDFDGFEEHTLKKLTLKLDFNELSHPGDTIVIHARFFDRNSDRYLSVAMNVIITDSELPLENTFSTYGLGSSEGYEAMATGMELEKMDAFQTVSETPEEHDKYHIQVNSLVDMTADEWKKGRLTVSYYDADLREIPVASDRLIVTTTGKKNSLNAGFIIPLFEGPDMHYLRVRWENDDHSKVLDIVIDRKS